MKLQILVNFKQNKDEIYLGKSGQLRFKSPFAKAFNLNKGERIQVATDTDESPCVSLYLIKGEKNGFKVMNGNGQFFMTIKEITQNLSFKEGSRFSYEEFDEAGYKGMKLTLINN